MTVRKSILMVGLAAIIGALSGFALAGTRDAAQEGTPLPPPPVARTESSVQGVVRSVRGFAWWKAGGPDFFPETARQIDCLFTDRSVTARMVLLTDVPDILTIVRVPADAAGPGSQRRGKGAGSTGSRPARACGDPDRCAGRRRPGALSEGLARAVLGRTQPRGPDQCPRPPLALMRSYLSLDPSDLAERMQQSVTRRFRPPHPRSTTDSGSAVSVRRLRSGLP